MKHWTLDDIPWEQFDPTKVDPETVKVVKAASMVEHNGHEYGEYLNHVFYDDPEFQEASRQWAVEEVQHGKALAKWAELADPNFDFDDSFRRYAAEIRLPTGTRDSVRGSRVGELVARCIVEVGTSSFYSAMGQANEEPVLREICKRIAADELRHYKMFYTYLKRYLDREGIGVVRRFFIGLGRLAETEDDELSYSYYAANHSGDGPFDRRRYARAYARRAYAYYRFGHVEHAIAMALKAAGLKPHGRISRSLAWLAYTFIRRRVRQLAAQGA